MQKNSIHRSLRKAAYRIHTWLGLHLCIALGIIFFTGTLLMYSPELTHISKPVLWTMPGESANRVSVGKIYDSALEAVPNGRVNQIGSQPRPWFGRAVYLSSGEGRPATLYVDPYTGAVLGSQEGSKLSLRKVIRKLHDSLLVPINLVHILVNALSFAVLALVITGLVTYHKFWKGYLQPIPRDGNHRVREGAKHRKIAIWVAPFLIASTLASSVFFLNAIGLKAKPGAAPAISDDRTERLPDLFNGTSLDSLVTSCKSEMNGFTEQGIKLPGSAKSVVKITGYDADIGSLFGGATCHVDPFTAKVAGIVKASDGNPMTQIKALAVHIHYGIFAGWFSIVLWTIFGAASTYLAITGARVYAARTLIKTANTANRSSVSVIIEGLGIFKWAYLAWILGAIALLIRDLL